MIVLPRPKWPIRETPGSSRLADWTPSAFWSGPGIADFQPPILLKAVADVRFQDHCAGMIGPSHPKLDYGPLVSIFVSSLFFLVSYAAAGAGFGIKVSLGFLAGSYFLFDGLRGFWIFNQKRRAAKESGKGDDSPPN